MTNHNNPRDQFVASNKYMTWQEGINTDIDSAFGRIEASEREIERIARNTKALHKSIVGINRNMTRLSLCDLALAVYLVLFTITIAIGGM